MRKALLLMAMIASALPPVAISANWAKEPTSFLGIAFDSPFPGNMENCPTRGRGILATVDEVAMATRAEPCAGPPYRGLFQVYAPPDLGFGYKFNVFSYDGKAGSFMLSSSSDNYRQIRKLLTTRYGPASTTSKQRITTKGGGKFTSERLIWKGRTVEIILDQLSGDINTSRVFASSSAYRQHEKQSSDRDATQNASKL